ncbi:WXG100 family type VII secretion target [Actinokineospora sp. NPDC004072]
MGAGSGDRYVVGGVNWESYTLEALIAMVSDHASPAQLEQLADDWRQAGNEVTAAATVLGGALEQLMAFWSGYAAQEAREAVAANAAWLGDLGETAHQIGDPIQEAAGALKAVQDAMPDLPADPLVPPARSVEGADAGLTNGGPLGAAISGTATGAESAFAAEAEQARLKEMAVEAMRRFEGAAIGIDEATPAFSEPTGPGPFAPREPNVPTPPPTAPPERPKPTDEQRWEELTTGGTTSSATGGEDPAYRPTPTGGGAPAFTGGATGITESPQPGQPRQPLAGGPAVGLTETFNPGNRPAAPAAGAIAASGTGAGAGMGGMPMGAGMGAGAANDSAEHRRRYPYDAENPFANDQKASPPVIGL